MFTEGIAHHLDLAKEEVARIEACIHELLEQTKGARVRQPDSELSKILKDALAGTPGWREQARRALGQAGSKLCAQCGLPFETGGKLRRRCARCSRNPKPIPKLRF